MGDTRVADFFLYLCMYGIVSWAAFVWGVKAWQADAVPDLAGIVALVGVIPVGKAAKVYIETRARKIADQL